MSDGMGCKCAARCETECCCDDVSWEPKEIQTARFKIADLTLQLAASEKMVDSLRDNMCEIQSENIDLETQLAAAQALIASKDALLEQARKALAAMVLEAKARYCGLRIAIEHYQTKGEES